MVQYIRHGGEVCTQEADRGGGKASRTRGWGRGHRGGRWVVALVLGLWPAFALAHPTCTLTQLTPSAGCCSGSPAINASGTRIAFTSSVDLTGENPDHRNEIFLANTLTHHLTQLTRTTGSPNTMNYSPAINASGTRIAFISNRSNTGKNPNRNYELFLVSPTTYRLTQFTRSTGIDAPTPAINASGTRIAFQAVSNLTGENPDRNIEIFLVNTLTHTVTQLTHSTGGEGSGVATINASGTRIAFESDGDLTGENPDGNWQLFLAQCDFGEQATTLCSTLGDGPVPARPDQDLFRLWGKAGEQVVITLEERLDSQDTGGHARLRLTADIPGVSFHRRDKSDLPHSLSATLPATGRYWLRVAEPPDGGIDRPFLGDYCVTLESSAHAWRTLEATGRVEDLIE